MYTRSPARHGGNMYHIPCFNLLPRSSSCASSNPRFRFHRLHRSPHPALLSRPQSYRNLIIVFIISIVAQLSILSHNYKTEKRQQLAAYHSITVYNRAGASRFHPYFPPHLRSPKHNHLVVAIGVLPSVRVVAPVVHSLPVFFLPSSCFRDPPPPGSSPPSGRQSLDPASLPRGYLHPTDSIAWAQHLVDS
jgi:hypothetical protein